MKKLLIGVMALALLAGCKKGENDPGISFRGRDARIVGEWKIASTEIDDNTETGSATKTITKQVDKYDGTKITRAVTVNGVASPQQPNLNTYTANLEITKEGTVIYKEVETSPQSIINTIEETGTWNWANSAKNKTTIIINLPGNGRVFSGGIYNIDQLKNKEVVFKNTENSSDKTTGLGSGGDVVNTNVETIILTQE